MYCALRERLHFLVDLVEIRAQAQVPESAVKTERCSCFKSVAGADGAVKIVLVGRTKLVEQVLRPDDDGESVVEGVRCLHIEQPLRVMALVVTDRAVDRELGWIRRIIGREIAVDPRVVKAGARKEAEITHVVLIREDAPILRIEVFQIHRCQRIVVDGCIPSIDEFRRFL